ncbi:MAG: hypothetical protein R3B13_00535 [Polyangiaceae bacterium]
MPLLFGASIAAACYLVREPLVVAETAAMRVFVVGAGLLGGFLASGLVFGGAWLPWAAVVASVMQWAHGSETKPRVANVSVPTRVRRALPMRTIDRWLARDDARTWRSWVYPSLAWLGLQLVAAGFDVRSVGWEKLASYAPTAVLLTALVWGVLATPLFLAQRAFLETLRHLMSALESLRLRPARLEDRPVAQGLTARVTDSGELTAPLSGQRCVGFCLSGEVDGVEIDDAFLSDFSAAGETKAVHIVSAGARLDLKPGPPTLLELDDATRTRLQSSLESRGLSLPCRSVRLAEAVLSEGNSIRLAGKAQNEPLGSAGYRDLAMRDVYSDQPEQALWIMKE